MILGALWGGADEKWKLAGKLPKICEGFLNM